MKIGTRSVLFGVHAFWLHPFFVALAWWRLYGFPWDPRLWVAFFVHDLGYLGKPNMDGDEGERHPVWGARLMTRLFDSRDPLSRCVEGAGLAVEPGHFWLGRWGTLTLLHSRFLAQHYGRSPSRLCYADKLAIVLTPWWVYLPLARASGELAEYMDPDHHEDGGKYEGEHHAYREDPKTWYLGVQDFLHGWLVDHVDVDPYCLLPLRDRIAIELTIPLRVRFWELVCRLLGHRWEYKETSPLGDVPGHRFCPRCQDLELCREYMDPSDFEEEPCWYCHGEGGFHDCGEDCCPCLYPEDVTSPDWHTCPECGGSGYAPFQTGVANLDPENP